MERLDPGLLDLELTHGGRELGALSLELGVVLLELHSGLCERLRHRVERAREVGHLVVAVLLDACLQITLLHAVRGASEPLQRTRHAPRAGHHEHGEQERDRQQGDARERDGERGRAVDLLALLGRDLALAGQQPADELPHAVDLALALAAGDHPRRGVGVLPGQVELIRLPLPVAAPGGHQPARDRQLRGIAGRGLQQATFRRRQRANPR